MKQLIWYGLQVIITSGILYGYYHFFLRNKKFHRYNRFYLLAATLLSLIIPFLNIPVYFSAAEKGSSIVLKTLSAISSPGTEEAMTAVIIPEHSATWFSKENSFFLLYLLIALIILFRMLFSLLKLRRIANANPVERLEKIRFISTDEPGTPFSFFRWLFWNRKIELHSEKGQQIFRHELFHIEQKHSADIVFMELASIFCWFNPFLHFLKKELKAIHEFLADQFAVTENTKCQYAELLLMRALDTQYTLVNPFFHNQIKRRITMIIHSSKPGHQYLRKLMALPLAALAFVLFAFSYRNIRSDTPVETITASTLPGPGNDFIVADTSKPLSGPDNKIFDRVEIEPAFPGGHEKWKKYLAYSLDANVPVKNKAPKGNYTVIVQFVVDKEGNISDVRTLTKHGYGMEQEAMRVLKAGPIWVPASQNGKHVKAYRKQPITFVVRPDKKTAEVIIPAFFPGGEEAWRNFLVKNIRASLPVDSGAPSGTYKAIVQFAVHTDGSLSDFEPVTKNGYGMEQEVVRLLKSGPKWLAAINNSKKIKSYVQQPVTFVITEDPDETLTSRNSKPKIPAISVSEIKNASPFELLGLSGGTEIIGYMFTTDHPNGEITESYNKGNQFNETTKRAIAELQPGRLVTFDQIRIMTNGNEKKMPGKVYAITD